VLHRPVELAPFIRTYPGLASKRAMKKVCFSPGSFFPRGGLSKTGRKNRCRSDQIAPEACASQRTRLPGAVVSSCPTCQFHHGKPFRWVKIAPIKIGALLRVPAEGAEFAILPGQLPLAALSRFHVSRIGEEATCLVLFGKESDHFFSQGRRRSAFLV
jgi:hypothetical protein